MMWFPVVSLLLLLIVSLDALGDAFRRLQKHVLHHVMESIPIMLWMAIWALFGFDWYYIAMYILARFAVFDLVYNLTVGHSWYYIGDSSIYDKGIKWFAKVARAPISYVVGVPKFIALVWFAAWALTSANR